MSNSDLLSSLRGRVAIVTGGAGHLGKAISSTLTGLGLNVAVADRIRAGPDRAEKFTGDVEGHVRTFAIDLADEAATRALPGAVVDVFGRLDILVNCAAFVGTADLEGWAVPFEQQSTAAWRAALEVNLTSVFALVQASLPALRNSGHGSIVNIGSIYGLVGPDMTLYEGTEMGNPAAYAASKGGLGQMTRWWSTVLAPDVRVNCVCPGGIFRSQPKSFVDRYVARTPLGRMGTEDDVVGGVVYFASDMSRYVTGQTLAVDGGWTAW